MSFAAWEEEKGKKEAKEERRWSFLIMSAGLWPMDGTDQAESNYSLFIAALCGAKCGQEAFQQGWCRDRWRDASPTHIASEAR
jgi:hypothetical protein